MNIKLGFNSLVFRFTIVFSQIQVAIKINQFELILFSFIFFSDSFLCQNKFLMFSPLKCLKGLLF